MYKIFWVLWPSFLVAGVAEGLFFTVIDPQELYLFGEPVHLSKIATYSIGFFCFWFICAASSLVTWFLQLSAAEINRGVGVVCPYVGPDDAAQKLSGSRPLQADPGQRPTQER